MATHALALTQCSAEYYETMAATAKVRLAIERGALQAKLIRPIYAMSRDFKELLDSLEKLEAYPSSILLEEEAKNIPEALRNLFRRTCDVMNHVTPLVEKPFGFLFASASSR